MFERAIVGLPVCQNRDVPRTDCPWYDWTAGSWDLVQATLLDDDVFADDKAVGSHLSEFGQDSVDMLVGVDEGDDDRQFASGFDQVRGVDFAPSQEAGHGMEGDGSEDVFFAQVFQDLQV